jgi:WD40 repeat protein
MVRTYGQMPKQIFISPHKRAAVSDKINETPSIVKGVKGLKHGIFTGSLQLPKPKKLTAKMPIMCKQKDSKLVLVRDLNMFFVIPSTSCLMKGSVLNSYDLVLWKEVDGIVRTKSLVEKRSRKIFSAPTCDPITTCGADIEYCYLWFGHLSGNISVYLRADERKQQVRKGESIQKTTSASLEAILDIGVENSNKASASDRENRVVKSMWNYPIILLKHRDEVVSIKICTDFKIAVSIGADGRAVIWDSQKIEYIRTIEASCNSLNACLSHVDVSPTLGDILTVFTPKNENACDEVDNDDECFEITENNGDDFINVSISISGKSQLRLHNINGKYIGHIFSEGVITAVCFSFVKEGIGINAIAAAFHDGSVRLYSTWNLTMIREICTGCDSMIKEISFSTNQYLILLTDHEIHLWGSDGLPLERPNFHDIIFVT